MKTFVRSLLIGMLLVCTGGITLAQYVDFSYDNNYSCAPMTVNFYNYSDTAGITGLPMWDWYIEGHPSYNTYEPPSIIFTEGGTFEVTLTLYDDMGYVGETTYYMYVYTDPDQFYMSTGPNACPGEPISFSFDDNVSWYSVLWDFGDATINLRNDNYVDHTFYNPGVYDVTLSIDHYCGTDTIVQQINVGAAAVPMVDAFAEGGNEICPNEIVFFNTMEDHMTYSWDFGDGTTSDERNPSHFFDTQVARNYMVTLEVTNSCGGIGKDSIEIQVTDYVEADAWFYYETHSGGNTACPNTPVKFFPQNSGTTYLWNFGDGSYSEERTPVNYYTEEGWYTITLILVNGCGEEAIYTDSIEIYAHSEDDVYAYFDIEVTGMTWDELNADTVYVCPGESIDFINGSNYSEDIDPQFEWDFGDGMTTLSKDASHVYTANGLYQVILTVTGPCGGVSNTWKLIMVDDSRFPDTRLSVVPNVICNGETVYFYDDMEYEMGRYVYDINFGDGEVSNNITDYADPVLHTLADHAYTGTPGQTFITTFNATNECGLTTSRTDTITITNDPAHKPFYYVQNTTTSEYNQPFNDWGVRRDPTDHEFIITMQWSTWPGPNDIFAVFFWYGEFGGDWDAEPPNGYVEFQTDQIDLGATISAYIPISPTEPSSVGFAAVWSCSGFYEQNIQPEVWAMQMDFLGMPQNSFPLFEGGMTDMLSIGNPIQLPADWNGICNEQKPASDYHYEMNPNTFIQLYFDEEYGEYYLDASADQEGFNWLTDISWGYYNLIGGNEIEFIGGDACTEMGLYTYVLTPDQITFTVVYDLCPDRLNYLTAQTFNRSPDFDVMYDRSACPGDNVNFVVAGGTSWRWFFGDGANSTMQNPTHSYAAPGTYYAYVEATNACGRIDTVYTPVKISSENIPPAYFWTDGWDYPRLEPIQFWWAFDGIDPAGNVSFEWDFGDGTAPSTLANPVHTYERDGDYMITLTVSNGCGSDTYTEWIYVRDAVRNCEAKFTASSIGGRTLNFEDISRGEVNSWFWEFGDGTTSSLQNPSHTYSSDGYYIVCLSIIDTLNHCATQVCKEIEVGTMNCKADFLASSNDATNTVQFTDRSVNAQEWFWDFGDGYFSVEQDPAHQYKEPGMYIVCLSIYNSADDCYSDICKEVMVGVSETDYCYAEFSYFVNEDNSVVFTDESSNNITNWYWTFGDGTFIDKRNPVHSFNAPGIYEVCLIVFDQYSGCSAEICKEIPVGVATCNLNAKFSYFVDVTNNGVTFSNRSTGDLTDFFWDFGDGTTSTAPSPSHKYTEPGFYFVTLSVWDKESDCASHFAELIPVVSSVDCRAAFEYKVDPATNEVKFYDRSIPIGNITEYYWDFDDGFNSDEQNPSHYFERPGIYFVSLTVVTSDGSMDFILKPIQVGMVECAARFTYFIDSANNVAYFMPEAMGAATHFLWYFGDGAISIEKNAKHEFVQPGYYTVGLNTFDETTGCMDYYEEVILIGRAGQDCRAGFTYMSDPDSRSIKFGNRSKGTIIDYIWDFGDGSLPSFDQNPEHTYPASGYYMVCLTVVNNFGLPNTYCDFVQLFSPDEDRCFAEFFYNVDSASKTVEFVQVSHGDPDEFLWDFGDGGTSIEPNPTHPYSAADYYLVGLRITNSSTNCSSTFFDLVNVGMGNQGLRASYTYTLDSSNLKADTYPIDFVGISLGDAGKLKWDFDDGTYDTTTLNPTHIYTQPGTYNVCLTISNPNTGDENTYCQQVTVGPSGIDPHHALNNKLGVFPNPFEYTTNIVYDLTSGTFVDLVVFDQTGRMVDILVREDQISGHYHLEYDGSKLDRGVYTLRLATEQGIYTTRMIIR